VASVEKAGQVFKDKNKQKDRRAAAEKDCNMVEGLHTANNTGKPVPLSLHPNFAPLRCAKLRLCPKTLV